MSLGLFRGDVVHDLILLLGLLLLDAFEPLLSWCCIEKEKGLRSLASVQASSFLPFLFLLCSISFLFTFLVWVGFLRVDHFRSHFIGFGCS